MKRIILFILLLSVLASCKSLRPIQTIDVVKDSVVTEEKLIRVVNPADSANLIALLECDENGKVIAKRFQAVTSKNVDLTFQIDSLSRLIANFITHPDTVYVPVKNTEKHISRNQDLSQVIQVEKPYSVWVILCIGFSISVVSFLLIKLILFIRTKILKHGHK